MLIQFGQLPEEDDDNGYKAKVHRMDVDGKKSNLAKMMYDSLSNPKSFDTMSISRKLRRDDIICDRLRPYLLIMYK